MAEKFFSDILTPYEAEHLIGEIKEITVEEYGSRT
jgi:hypothetical protein